jgi:hypothetical protein
VTTIIVVIDQNVHVATMINCHGLSQVLRVGVLTEVENDGNTRGTGVLYRFGPL